MTQILICVRGGVVQEVRANGSAGVTVFDIDNLKEEGFSSAEIDQMWAEKEKDYPIGLSTI